MNFQIALNHIIVARDFIYQFIKPFRIRDVCVYGAGSCIHGIYFLYIPFSISLKKSPENVYSTVQKETNHDDSLITVKVVPHSMSDLGFFSVGDNFIFFGIESDKTNHSQENKKKRFSVSFLECDITISVISHGMSLFVL